MNSSHLAKLMATALTVGAVMPASAANLNIKVENLTQGIHFTPLLIAAHTPEAHLFQTGTMATAELQAMAEGGDISGLSGIVDSVSGDKVENPADGLLAPASYTMTDLMTTDGNTALSIVAMMLPTNDGFIGVDNWMIPETPGTYTIYVNAYDAGTEANDEIINGGGAPGAPGIPVAPGGNGGMNGSGLTMMEANTYVHIHPGNIGDDIADGGKSDLDNTIHRWLNPVAKITVVVSE